MTTFKQWIKQFDKQQNAFGDLARDIASDKKWPKRCKSKDEISYHLGKMRASEDAINTFEAAYTRYEYESSTCF